MKYWACDYCGSLITAAPVYATDHRFGILPCVDHERLAKRDVNAWFHKNNSLRVVDFLATFPEIASVPNILANRHVFKDRRQWVVPVNMPGSTRMGLMPIISQKMIEILDTGIYRADYEEWLSAKHTQQDLDQTQSERVVEINKN